MNMKEYCIHIFFFVSIATAFGQEQLDSYINEAVTNNPGLKAKYAEFEIALQKVAQMSSLDDPRLSISSFGQMVETRVGQQMARFTLEQMFPWFGTLKAQKNAAALMAESDYEAWRSARIELIMNVKMAYYPIYEIDESIRLQRENLEILSSLKTLATTRFQSGKGTLADALRVDLMTNEAETEIMLLAEMRKSQVVKFNRLLNRGDGSEVVVDRELQIEAQVPGTRDSIASHPKLIELQKQVQASQYQQKLAVKQGMPMLGLGADYIITQKRPGMTFEDNGKDAYMAMFTVSLPIYRKKYAAAIREAELMGSAYQSMYADMENEFSSEYEMARYQWIKAKEEASLFERQSRQTQQIIDLLLTSYENSGADFEEILKMQQELVNYKIKTAGAIKENHIAKAKIDFLTSTH